MAVCEGSKWLRSPKPDYTLEGRNTWGEYGRVGQGSRVVSPRRAYIGWTDSLGLPDGWSFPTSGCSLQVVVPD